MDKKAIDTIVWWIPFKKTRNAVRECFNTLETKIATKQNLNRLFLAQNNYLYKINYKKKDLSKRYPVTFYLPDYPNDGIQNMIMETQTFFAEGQLVFCEKYIPKNSVIIDIGANIGNHTLYWGITCAPQKIISFEPFGIMYDHLCKHIELNNLTSIVETHNLALGETITNANFDKIYYTDMGSTSIKKDNTGSIKMNTMDNMILDQERINFIKIDVEGYEYYVLKGGKETIKKFKPVIMLEIWTKELYDAIESLFDEYEYHRIDFYSDSGVPDYIFAPKNKSKEDYILK